MAQWFDSEASLYDFAKPGPQPGTANFVQAVWAGTSSVGMAVSHDGKYCVANFFPRGNTHPLDHPKMVLPLSAPAPPPWCPADPGRLPTTEEAWGCCTQDAWERHDETTAGLKAAQERRPCD